ncbi:anaphase-promoting complex subunit 5 isoform X2 [Amyelois transitella]|uniref:anaphase-promoting complex subunit 5 isoform X2 n=1 Tax=Amyelois transitella TaxID=680683 RepID=UPI0029902C41|nr:anaphase-promoting complex subunit 5 isoform X2 [Amyelois transitella]
MDLIVDSLDFIKVGNARGSIENITPHKIAVVAFIREYGLLKIEAKEMTDCIMAPKYRKDFCILALKLIQCPDMEFKELEALLTDGRYNLLSVHLQNFCVRLQNIYANGISALKDCVTSTIDKLMIEQSETNPCIITRYSVLGFYLRRIMLYLDKLSFNQVVSLYKSFCLYYQRGRPGLMMRSLSKEKLNNVETQAAAPSTSPVLTEETKSQEFSMRMNIVDRDNFEEAQWSRKQAELFIAQQANLLQINEKKALPPKQLQKTIIQIMNDVHDLPEIHFLSFLNCIRMREFCGAQDSLYHCFDRTVFSVSNNNNNVHNNNPCNDKNKNIRYAALNRAAMHTQFGHKTVAMEGVREALAAAQEAGDGACLAHAAAWGALAGGRALRDALLARAPRLPRAPRQASAAAQLLAQHAAVNGAKPADVFQIITKGDTINYLHSMTDLTMAGLANTAALWSLYGKTEMASVNCQLLLNLNTKNKSGSGSLGRSGSVRQWPAAGSACGAGAAMAACWRAQPALAHALAHHARARGDAHHVLDAHVGRCHAQQALQAGKWEEADQSIKRLASLDRWESQLLKAEMFFLKGDSTESLRSLHDVLDYCKTEDDSLHYISLRLKAMILMSQVQHTFSSIQSTNIMILNEALSLAKKYHLHYLAATAEMHIANVQLHSGCAKNALVLVRKVLPTIMAHGSAYDIARSLLLYTKCRIASAPVAGESRVQVLQSCCEALDFVKKNFAKVGANARLLQTWYLQAQLFHDMGNHAARNQCAWMYRQLETQNPVLPSNMLLIMF